MGCLSMYTPTIDGYELAIGDDLGIGFIPYCCGEDMVLAPKHAHLTRFKCTGCRVTLTVNERGLVFDIR